MRYIEILKRGVVTTLQVHGTLIKVGALTIQWSELEYFEKQSL